MTKGLGALLRGLRFFWGTFPPGPQREANSAGMLPASAVIVFG